MSKNESASAVYDAGSKKTAVLILAGFPADEDASFTALLICASVKAGCADGAAGASRPTERGVAAGLLRPGNDIFAL